MSGRGGRRFFDGQEHRVGHDRDSGRVLKITFPDCFGIAFPIHEGLPVSSPATPLEYLSRMRKGKVVSRSNAVLPDPLGERGTFSDYGDLAPLWIVGEGLLKCLIGFPMSADRIDSIAINDYNDVMSATLTIRNLGDGIKQQLRIRAAENGRSMEAEVRAILAHEFAEAHQPETSGDEGKFDPLLGLWKDRETTTDVVMQELRGDE